jgi:hypothetical protein
MTPAEQAALLAYQQEQQRAAAQNQQDQGGLLDTLGKLALGAGAAAAGVYGARRLLRGAGAVAPSKVAPSAAEVRRAAGAVPADVARQQRGIELTRLARAERPQGVVQTNLDQLVQAVLNDLPDEANKAAANQFLARGKERAGVTGALTKATPSPTEFLNEAVEQVAVKVLDQPGTAQLQGRTFQALPVGRATTEELAAGQRLLEDPELLSLVKQQTAEELSEARSYQSKAQAEYRNLLSERAEEARSAILKEANTTQAAAQEDFANQYLRNQGYTAADTLVDQHQDRIVTRVDHFANAVNSAEDQTTGRVKAALQRNEDTNLAAIEMAEDAVDQQLARLTQQSPEAASSIDVDAAINQVASQLADGLPVDQAEVVTTVRGFGFQPTQPGLGLQQQAARSQRYGTPTKVSVIGQYPAVSEQAPASYLKFPGELGSSAGEEIVVTEAQPFTGLTNIRRGGVEFTAREGRVGEQGRPGRYTVLPPGTPTEGRTFTGPSTPTLSADEIANKLAEIQVSREAQVQNAMSRGLTEARARRQAQLTESQKQALEASLPSYSTEDVMSRTGMVSYGDITEAERFSEEAASRSGQLKALEEGGFLEEQVDPGQVRTEPRTVKYGTMVRPASKTSYRGVTGLPGTGVYGTIPGVALKQVAVGSAEPFGAGAVRASKVTRSELGESRGITTPLQFTPGESVGGRETPEGFTYTGTAMSQPTRVSQRELVEEAMAKSTADPYGDVPVPPSISELTEQDVNAQRLKSVDVSRNIMNIMKSAPPDKAQALVNQYVQSLRNR